MADTQLCEVPVESTVLQKDAVLEYLTKYMTKSGQGALVEVMEHSFALCIEESWENKQGAGSAVLRWFNMQSITEVKSQLECMHPIFGARGTSAAESSSTYIFVRRHGK